MTKFLYRFCVFLYFADTSMKHVRGQSKPECPIWCRIIRRINKIIESYGSGEEWAVETRNYRN